MGARLWGGYENQFVCERVFTNLQLVEPLNPRDSFFGGRTNSARLHYKVDEGENIKYIDINSLYPYVNKTKTYIHDIRICTEDIVELSVSKVEEEIIPGSITNIFIASFMTSWASLELYKYLEQLKKQVLYFNTDSIMYFWREGLPGVETGPFLGQMKDETAGVPIYEFVTGGPKNYSYKLQNGDTESKVRGFTLDEQASELLNFESMKRHILAEIYHPELTLKGIEPPRKSVFNQKSSAMAWCLTSVQ